jgi:FdhD protein
MKKKMTIDRYQNEKFKRIEDEITVECELTLQVGNKSFHLMCSPDDHRELAIGFLYNAGLIETLSDIGEFIENENHIEIRLKRQIEGDIKEIRTSGCLGMGVEVGDAVSPNSEKATISAKKILNLSEQLNRYSGLFRETGGVHASLAILTDGTELFYEDIGRHNTFDKLTGAALILEKTLEESIVMTTGRISSEMVMKSARNNVSVLISRSAPTNLAVQLAKDYKIVLIGFARGNRFNRYTLKEADKDVIIN